MVERKVYDTNVLEELNTDQVVVPEAVSSELDARNVNDGIVDEVESVSVDRVGQCVDDNIAYDIKKKLSRGRRRKSVVDNFKEAEKQRSEEGRQEFLRRAWKELPDAEKSWNGEVSGAVTDCQVLELGEKTGEVLTNDRSILEECKDKEGVTCKTV
ncbi:MAG: hypothetical protein ABEI78_00590 [Candidatus Nanohaloarchaea archaeon]